MFTKEERSSFKYWFAHWCAFQLTALNQHCWKFRFLFHDFEKPWLKLLWNEYLRVQKWHRTHNSHHIEYWLEHDKADWLAMAIDWECSRLTKEAQPLNARQTLEVECSKLPSDKAKILRENLTKIFEQIGL